MKPLDDRMKAMLWLKPSRIPVGVGLLPSAWMKHREAMDAIVARHPLIFGASKSKRDYDAVGRSTYVAGEHVDAWGCVWSNVKTGLEAIVTRHPVPTRESVRSLRIPEEDDGMPHGFMYLRLGDLRGFEEIMVDFAEEPPELQMLIDKVLAYNLRLVRGRVAALREPEQLLYFGDDLGLKAAEIGVSPDPLQRDARIGERRRGRGQGRVGEHRRLVPHLFRSVNGRCPTNGRRSRSRDDRTV